MRENEIRRLIKIVEETGINEIEVTKWWGYKVRIVKNGGMQFVASPDINTAPAGPVRESAQTPEVETPKKEETSHHVVSSPMVGTFYRAPAPDEAAFVSVGDTVREGQTLCIIEAMKVMNEIDAEVSGTVVEILVDNAEPVEFNRPLFHIDESKS
ncbi:MAG: acetyl-CoA carboxylase biotin carboxyl carrier protein [bacterium]|nr:acetyl-CoA carboxylase biotin carboxyl carrier protein [bacterium]